MQQNTSKKKIAIGQMLIEQINQFELGGPGPPGCTCTTTTGYFHDETKISMENLNENMFWT